MKLRAQREKKLRNQNVVKQLSLEKVEYKYI